MSAVGAAGHDGVVITGLGMRSSLGQNVIQSCASVRAGISRFGTWPPPPPGAAAGGEDGGVELVGAPVVPDLGDRDWVEKLDDLATQPLHEALWMAGLQDAVEEGSGTRWGLVLALPPIDRTGVDAEAAADLREELAEGVLFGLEVPALSVTRGGNTGALRALERATTALAGGACDVCVVGGVDSLLHTPYLAELADAGRLKTSVTPAGLIPGEAAAFVVVERAADAARRDVPALLRFTPPRVAVEARSPDGRVPGRGEAVATVLRAALADAPCAPGRVAGVVNDLNGERWRFLEWSLACNPALSQLPSDWRPWHPADCLGDVGAATGAVHLCLAARAFARGYARGDALLVFNASENGERAALSVHP